MLAELIEEPMSTELDNVMAVFSAKLDTLCVKIDALQAQLASSELRVRECRAHCEDTSGSVLDRLNDLEKRTLADFSAKNATDTLRREMETQFNTLEDRRVQGSQTFWIRIGSLVAGVAILQTLMFFILEKVFK